MTNKMTTEEFIAKAKKVHGDKYDYSKTVYKKSSEKVVVTCPVHGDFEITPNHHLSGRGCRKCQYEGISNIYKRSKVDFIKKAREVHGDKYDYSLVPDEVLGKDYVDIICPVHGKFNQQISRHLDGQGCPSCGGSKKITNEEFIERARIIHNNFYDYSKTIYVSAHEKVVVTCPIHGDFEVSAHSHLSGTRCPKCIHPNANMTRDEFIEKAINIFGNVYDYSLLPDKIIMKKKVNIICKTHGVFSKTPHDFLIKKSGCPKCHGFNFTTEDFIAKSKEIFGDKFNYSKTTYVNAKTPLIITCPLHGDFETLPYIHFTYIKGCPKCMRENNRLTLDDFIKKAREVHGNKYDYSLVKGISKVTDKITIVCPEHGPFTQQVNLHLNGAGCPNCAGLRKEYKLSLLTENDIQKNPLDNRFFCLKSVEILALIKAGVLPKDFMSIARTPRGSRARLEAIQTLISTIESGEETETTEESNDVEGNTSMDVESVETLEAIERIDEETNDSELVVDETTGLPILDDHTNVLRNGDINGLDKLSPTSENGKFIVANTIQTWWQIVSDDEDFVNEIRNYHGSKFYDYIKEEFFKEYNAIITMPKPEGYSLPYELYPYQKILAHKLETRSSYSLWLDMGGGKTYSAINASRHNGLKNTMVVAPKSVLEESWISSVYEMFPDSNVIAFFGETKNDFKVKVTGENFASAKAYNHWIDTNVTLIHNINEFQKTDGKYTYFLINYDKFSQSYAKELVNTIVDKCEIDYVILDEIQKVKYRESTGEVSSRHQHVGFLLSEIRKRNPLVKASALTGTPLINELSEVKSIIELVSGEEVSGIKNNRVNIGNVSEANKAIVLNGFRYRPVINVKHVLITPEIDCDAELEKTIRELANRKSYYGELESALAIAKIKSPDVIKEIKPGTIIYVLYPYKNNTATEIIRKIESLGFKVGAYLGCTPNKHEVFEDFVNGKTDVLVASSPISIGVNGLQNRSDRMIIISLPQTNADYEQLIKRIVRKRKGNSLLGEKDVTIIVPQIILELNDDDDSDEDDWSWDRSRMNALLYKKNLGEAVMDGDIQKVFRIDWNKLYRNAMKRLKEGVKDESEIVKNKVVVLEPEEREKREYSASVVNNMHRLANTSNHGTMHKYFQEHPEAFQRYHEHRNTENWVEDPVDYIASFINGHYSNKKIADLGCGKNKLSTLMKNGNTVTGFDHMRVEGHDEVVVADIANLNGIVKDKEFDIALFCLSLWGKDYEDYFNEANRILKNYGWVIVVEPNDCFGEGEKYGDESEFINLVEKHGFYRMGGVTKRNGFSYFRFLKED